MENARVSLSDINNDKVNFNSSIHSTAEVNVVNTPCSLKNTQHVKTKHLIHSEIFVPYFVGISQKLKLCILINT